MNQFHKVHGLHKQQSTIISKNYKKVVMQYRSGHLQKSIKWKEQTDSENQGETNKIIILITVFSRQEPLSNKNKLLLVQFTVVTTLPKQQVLTYM